MVVVTIYCLGPYVGVKNGLREVWWCPWLLFIMLFTRFCVGIFGILGHSGIVACHHLPCLGQQIIHRQEKRIPFYWDDQWPNEACTIFVSALCGTTCAFGVFNRIQTYQDIFLRRWGGWLGVVRIVPGDVHCTGRDWYLLDASHIAYEQVPIQIRARSASQIQQGFYSHALGVVSIQPTRRVLAGTSSHPFLSLWVISIGVM